MALNNCCCTGIPRLFDQLVKSARQSTGIGRKVEPMLLLNLQLQSVGRKTDSSLYITCECLQKLNKQELYVKYTVNISMVISRRKSGPLGRIHRFWLQMKTIERAVGRKGETPIVLLDRVVYCGFFSVSNAQELHGTDRLDYVTNIQRPNGTEQLDFVSHLVMKLLFFSFFFNAFVAW